MTRLSENFTSEEFECSCCGETLISPTLILKLQSLRDLVGEPIYVASGYRCPQHNKSVGGYSHSPHLTGEGADIRVKGWLPMPFAIIASKITGIRIGCYPNHIHIDIMPPAPSKYWLVKKYGDKYIYSGNETNLAKFLKNNL